jgi:hypothetical protein
MDRLKPGLQRLPRRPSTGRPGCAIARQPGRAGLRLFFEQGFKVAPHQFVVRGQHGLAEVDSHILSHGRRQMPPNLARE